MPGAKFRLWRHYTDDYVERRVYAMAMPDQAPDALSGPLSRLEQPPVRVPALANLPRHWFCPAPYANASCGTPIEVTGVSTGSRTLSLSAESARRLGIPDRVLLDLRQMGWGQGVLEMKPEVKGAGAPLSRTRLDNVPRDHISAVLSSKLAPSRTLHDWTERFKEERDPLWTSLFAYERRPLGAQSVEFGTWAKAVSTTLLGRCPVRVAPTPSMVSAASGWRDVVAQAMAPAASSRVPAFTGALCTELRYTPGHVRAVYFDTVRDDDDRVRLIDAVSEDDDVLSETYSALIADLRRYIETLAIGTRTMGNGLVWPKFGDIHIVFRPDRHGRHAWADEYRSRKHVAWYLAKDEVVVGGLGKVVVDAESVAPCFPASGREHLRWQHDLYLLNLLRDHARVVVGFLHALQAKRFRRGGPRPASQAARDRQVAQDLLRAGQDSGEFALFGDEHRIAVTVWYPHLHEADLHQYSWKEIFGRSLR